ncbi:hypothetical protein MMC10_005064 [Thelotrema lepadinum]|nr:hypothetical protein [Thelotrema lepadinum]
MCHIDTDVCLVPLPNNLFHVKQTIKECPGRWITQAKYDQLREDEKRIYHKDKKNWTYHASYLEILPGMNNEDCRRPDVARCFRNQSRYYMDKLHEEPWDCWNRSKKIPKVDHDILPRLLIMKDKRSMEAVCREKHPRNVRHYVKTLEEIMTEIVVPIPPGKCKDKDGVEESQEAKLERIKEARLQEIKSLMPAAKECYVEMEKDKRLREAAEAEAKANSLRGRLGNLWEGSTKSSTKATKSS